jgi:hypothetical protein
LAVEPRLRVEHREELVWLLAQACELEHGLMCEYLFAQFSLKRSGEEGLIVEQGEGARGHRRNAHFGKFVALLEDYLATRAADPGFEPARPVEPAYVHRPPGHEAETLTTTDPLTDRADRLSGTAGLAQLAELAGDLHGMARDIESA